MISEVIKRCRLEGVELYLENDQLKFRVRQGRLSAELKQELIAHKETLIAFLRGAEWTSDEIPTVPRDGALACSFSQQRLWFVDKLEGGSAQYNLPAALRLRGAFEEAILQRAVDTIVERHEVLRTTYRAGDDGAVQVIHPFRTVPIRRLDAATDIQALARDEAGAAFDLASDLMLRVTLVTVAEDEHVLLFTMHHIASDGWSMGVLVREFVTLYAAFSEGAANPLPPLPIQYADYAAWQRELPHGASLQYWKQRLDGIPQIHSLPLDKPRGLRQSFVAGKHQQRFERRVVDALLKLGREQDATLFMVLQSAFALLLARWSRENDIVMAVPTAGRTVTAVEPLIGFFINTLVFRNDLSRDESFRELLGRAKRDTLEAYAHQQIPFETLVDELKPERALSYNPICQIKFVLQNHRTADSFGLPGLEIEAVSSGVEKIRFDLDLTAAESPEGLLLNWSFKDDLFEAATIERMADAFRVLVEGVLANPDASIRSLPLLADASSMLALSRGVVATEGRELPVHRAFEAQVVRTPDALAVNTLTYTELNERANRLAHYLLEQGIGSDSRVGLYAERSPEVLVGMLAILKTGTAYVPFEPSNTAERLSHIVASGAIECVLVQSSLVDKVPVKGVDLILLDEEFDGYATENPDTEASLDGSAYVIYTSGSTGVPKGVEITHAGLIDYCAYASERYYRHDLDGSLVVTSHGFDITVPSLYVPLLHGGRVQLTAPGEELNALAIDDGGDYLLRMTPMHLSGLLASVEGTRENRHVFVIGGEAFPPALAREVQARFPNAQIYNHYGPTETVVGCAIYDVSANLDRLGERLPIGRPMANTELYVLNEAMQVNPAGVAGELFIGGAGVAKGYVNQPELTAEKFVPNPFGEGRLYRSGDVVRYLPSGDLEFLGRADDQLKVRGFRIEPGEIESVIKQTASDALVVVQGEGEHRTLVAYVVGGDLSEVKLRVKAALPEYMVPGAWCELEAFPLNANGKIDRKKLPAMDRKAAQYVAAETETETRLTAIWREILKLDELSVTANFFELGGHSLLATRVMSAVSHAFHKTLPVRTLFEHNTVRTLASHLDAQAVTGAVAIPKARLETLRPATALQQGMFFHGPDAYVTTLELTLRGGIDADALRRAWEAVVNRHAALRTAFVERDGVLQQLIVPHAELPWNDAAPFDFAQPLLHRVTFDEQNNRLVWAHHDSILDARSASLVLRDVFRLYRGEALDDVAPYEPYAQWLAGRDAEAAKRFWRETLGDFHAPTLLPTGKQNAIGHRELAIALPVTPSEDALQRAWGALLQRYSGESDVVFGVVRDGRQVDVAGIDEMVGAFSNIVPVRLSGERLLVEERAAHDFGFLPLAGIQQQSGVPAGMPLFDSLLVFERPAAIDDTLVESMHAGGATHYALTLTLDAGGIQCSFAADRFSEETVQRLLEQLKCLLAGGNDAVVSERDRAQLALWNGERAPFDASLCVHQLFERHAAATPDAIALEFQDQRLTYRELNERANRLAHWLIARGVGPETLVGISVDRSPDLITGILGILKAGGAYVPLDPGYPASRLAHMIADCAMPVVLTQSHLAGQLPLDGIEAFLLDRSAGVLESHADSDPEPRGLTSANLCYVIYTSGSTGLPKGVMIEHRQVQAQFAAVHARYAPAPRSRVLSVSSFSFDIFVEELSLSLLAGGTLVLTAEGLAVDAARFWSIIEGSEITAVSLPTSYLHYLCAELTEQQAGIATRTLRLLIAGGEALLSEHVARWQRLAGKQVAIWNSYGPTECTVSATVSEVTSFDAGDTKNPPIGRPLPNYECWVFDPAGALCPIQVPGELYIGGEGVGRGYLHREELTAKQFVAHPFREGARLYRTGDLVRFVASGELEFLGRIDQQVKIRGFRVEVGEIETALLQSGLLKEAVVVATGKSGEQQLVAYVVPDAADAALADTLRDRLRGALPAYMVPNAYVVLEALPLTVNGKVDKRALPAPDRQSGQAHVAPATATEAQLAKIWQDVLKLDGEVSTAANFFELGGHSLLAMRVVTAVSATFDKTIPVRSLFEHSTIRQLSLVIDRQESTEHVQIRGRQQREEALPLSFAQQRLWFIDQLEGGSAQYNMPAAMRLTGPLDVAAVQQALDEILRRHEILRTTCHEREGAGVQVVNPWRPFPMTRIDLTGWDAAMQEAEVERLAAEEAATIFDLRRDLMLRVCLVTLSAREHAVFFAMHHIASDGWSLTVLAREFMALYEAFTAGAASPLPPLEVQYGDYARWQRDTPQAALFERQLGYWKRQLDGIPQIHSLPLDLPRTATRSLAGGSHRQHLGTDVLQGLKQLAQQNNVTMFMLLQTAFVLLLGRWSNEDDIVVGTPTAGRTHKDLEPLIGFFVNTLLLRTDLSGAVTFEELLKRNQLMALDAYSNQDIPFEAIVDELKPERNLSHTTMFQITFAFENHEKSAMELPGIEVTPLGRSNHIAKFDLNFAAGEDGDGLQFVWNYASSLFHPSTIERMAASFEVLLRGLTATPAVDVHRLRIATESDDRRIAAWNAQQQPFPDACIHELFEAQARRAPDAIAVVCDSESLTYGELNRRANRLARWLVERCVAHESFVGVCMERSPELAIALVAILKAGGAYVPLDPSYPVARQNAILEDSGASIVLRREDVAAIDGSAEELATAVTTRSLAYLIYTSGSTGTPKGVMVEHRSVVRLVAGNHFVPLNEASRILQASSPSFDAATFEIWGALLNGGTLVLYPEKILDLEVLNHTLESHGVNTLWLTSGLFEQWSQQLPGPGALRYVLAGGDVVNPRAVERVYRSLPDVQVINGYGPTENTTFTCCYAIPRDADFSQPIPLGKAINGTTVHVLNEAMTPVPLGAVGELFAGGPGLARGYWNQPELTAAKFANGFYRTGDLVRQRTDGVLEFIGRADDQVKIRGFRIELGEIAAQLLRCTGVQDAIVLARGEGAGKRLAAYVLGATSPDDLRHQLRQQLPDYMVPAAIVVMDAFPLNSNGKVDRAALPEPDFQQSESYVAPRTETERQLAAIWQQLLKLDRVGVEDNFFSIGGDSILSIQAVSRANQAGIRITTRQLFENQTIAALAAVALGGVTLDAPQDAIAGALELLPIQREFLTDGNEDRQHFNQSVLLVTPAGFSIGFVREMVAAIYRRHDALRLRFVQDGQGVWTASHEPLSDAMLAASCIVEPLPADLTARCDRYQRAFDLEAGPLFKVVFFEGAEEGRLFLLAHHIIVDGVSWRILLADIERAYEQHQRGERIDLGAKTSSFQQWGAALAGYATSAAAARERTYWLSQYDHAAASLPVDFTPDEVPTAESARRQQIRLSQAETQALLQRSAHAYRTTINELLLSGLYLGMRRWTGSTGLRIALEGHGRELLFDRLDTTQTVGWFTTVYPLTLHSRGAEVADVIKAVKEQYRAVPENGIGFGILRYLANDPELAARAADGDPQVVFNYLGQLDQSVNDDSGFQGAPESTGASHSERQRRSYQLVLNGKVIGGELLFGLDYSSFEYRPETMATLAGFIEDGLRAVIAHCVSLERGAFTPSDFPLARVSQEQLDEWQRAYPSMTKLYPATAMQQGMYFHGLLDRSAYVTQMFPILRGNLSPERFRKAWETVANRHDVFRTAFLGEEADLHQLVVAAVSIPFHVEDWRALSAEEQQVRFAEYRAADKSRGFDFGQAPLQRVALFRLDEERWQLLWTHHHLLLDGWSIPIVYEEAMLAYEGAALEAPAGFEAYMRWLGERDREEARAFWAGELGDFESATPLGGIDRLPGGAPGIGEMSFTFGDEESRALDAFARSQQTTLNTVMQLAWAYLLHRYSGEDEVVFGSLISGRPAEVPGIEQMVGLFINMLPVRVSFAGAPDTATLLGRIQRSFQESQQFGFLPLPEVQRQSGVRSGEPLFQTVVAFENYPLDTALANTEAQTQSFEIERSGADEGATSFKLVMVASYRKNLKLRCDYRTDEFSGETIARLMEHLQQILRGLPTLGEIAAPSELEQIARWNATQQPMNDRFTHELFEEQAARTPSAIAAGGMTYDTLNKNANRLARHLITRGVKPGSIVGLCVERSEEEFVGILAAWKAGAAYMPLDPSYPQERLQAMVADSGTELVLTQSRLLGRIDAPALVLLEDAYEGPDDNLGIRGDIAYVIYTSGSTGVPKGVSNTHAGLVNLCAANRRKFGHGADAVAAHFISICFDASVYEVWPYLVSGGRIAIIGDEERTDALRLATRLHDERVTHCIFPTALLEHVAHQDVPPELWRHLRVLIAGGEKLNGYAMPKGCTAKLVNAYGPTEATVMATTFDVEPGFAGAPPIGSPIDNVTTHVLGKDGRPVPIGVTGELFIGGAGLAAGYLHRPELTAERFVQIGGERLYRTGDLARWLPDGNLEFSGRSDEQVKIRGFRIEPGEITARLLACEGVAEALVVARKQQLVAYVVGTADRKSMEHELRQQLPAYMIPSAFVTLEAFPRTSNDKIDRNALPEPEWGTNGASLAPRTATESDLVTIWEEVLGYAPAGVEDHFFEHGGHSLLASQAMARIRRRVDVDLPLIALFEHPTPASLARVIDDARGTMPAAAPIGKLTNYDNVPLTFAQQRLWFIEQYEEGNTSYNLSLTFRVGGSFDAQLFVRALGVVAERQWSLRTRFRPVDGGVRQEIVDAIDLPVVIRDETDREVVAEALRFEGSLPFDVANELLWRGVVYRIAEDEHWIGITIHHAITDGWSNGIFKSEVLEAYEALVRGEEPNREPLPLQYADYAAWQQRTLDETRMARLLDYWKLQLDGMPKLHALPLDHPRPKAAARKGGAISFEIDDALHQELKALSARSGATLYMVLVAAFSALVARLSGRDDVVIGTPMANRPAPELERVIGFFVNTVLLRMTVDGGQEFERIIEQARTVTLAAQQHQEYPFERLVAELQPERNSSAHPLFQLCFILNNMPGGPRTAGVDIESVDAGEQAALFDLMLSMHEQGERLTGTFYFNAGLFRPGTVETIIGKFKKLLAAVARDPKLRVEAIELAERQARAAITRVAR